jgi:WD40 repeat protein
MEVRKPTMISSVSWCGRQELLAIGDERGTVKIYDVEKVKQIRTYDNHT